MAAVANQIHVQQAKVESAKIRVWQTEQEYTRIKKLYEQEAATLQNLEDVRAAFEIAQMQYQALRQEYQTALLNTRKEAAAGLPDLAHVQVSLAEQEKAEIFLAYTVITAPYNGWVGKRNLQPGQLIQEGQTLVHVVSEEKWIDANYRETQIEHLALGSSVRIHVDAYPKLEFRGHISSFSPASGAAFSMLPSPNVTGNFVKIEQRIPIKIEFDKQQNLDLLRAGMNVVVHTENKESHEKR